MIKLGVNLSMIFNEVPLIERFALARQMGFDTVEIQFPYELSIEQIQQQLTQHDLQICLINVQTSLEAGAGLSSLPERKQDFKLALTQALDYAQQLNIPTINVLSGRINPEQLTTQQALDCFIDNLALSIDEAKKRGIQVVFEMINGIDMPHFLVQNLEIVDEILTRLPEARLQFDCYHVARNEQDVLQKLVQYLPYIGHIQFADYPNRHEPNTGELAFADIFAYLQQSDYQGFVCAEYKPAQHSMQSFAWKQQFFA